MGGGCNLVAHTASRQEAAVNRLICAARRSKRHDTYERLQCKLSVSAPAARGPAPRAKRPKLSSGGGRPAGGGRGAVITRTAGVCRWCCPRRARAPWVVPTGHGAGAGRRARPARRPAPGRALASRARAALASWTRYIQTSTLHNTSRRRERTVRSRVCTTQRGHSTKEPPLRIRTIIVNSESDPESGRRARPLSSPARPMCGRVERRSES